MSLQIVQMEVLIVFLSIFLSTINHFFHLKMSKTKSQKHSDWIIQGIKVSSRHIRELHNLAKLSTDKLFLGHVKT